MKRKGRKKVFYFIILFIVGFFLIFISLKKVFPLNIGLLSVKTVDVKVNNADCTSVDQIENAINLLGQNILFLDEKKVANEMKNKFLCVGRLQIIRHLPNKISILVSSRIPRAEVFVRGANVASESASLETIATSSAMFSGIKSSFLLDNTGMVFEKNKNVSGITKIYYNGDDLKLGEKSELLIQSFKILDKVKSFGLNFSQGEILNEDFILYPTDSLPEIIFKLQANEDEKLASLQLILGQAKIDKNQLNFIDLRFDKPIVKFAPKRNG